MLTLITDSETFAVMSKVSQVLIATNAVLADGGLLANSGTFNTCLAAKAHNIPVLVLCGLHQLTPIFPFDNRTFNELLSPCLISDIDFIKKGSVLPRMDYIPPEFLSLLITN